MDGANETKGKTKAQRAAAKRPQTFGKGNPGGPGVGGKPVSKLGDDFVEDLKRAYSTDETPEDPPAIKAFRRMAKKDPVKFAEMVLKAEAAQARARPAGAKEAQTSEQGSVTTVATSRGGVGEKEVRVRELIDRLLAEWDQAGGGR